MVVVLNKVYIYIHYIIAIAIFLEKHVLKKKLTLNNKHPRTPPKKEKPKEKQDTLTIKKRRDATKRNRRVFFLLMKHSPHSRGSDEFRSVSL